MVDTIEIESDMMEIDENPFRDPAVSQVNFTLIKGEFSQILLAC